MPQAGLLARPWNGDRVPELPEVETIVRGLRPLLTGQTITQVEVYWERTIATPSPAEFRARLPGQQIVDVYRRGKFIVLHLERDDLLVHLRMTGRLLIAPAGQPPEGRRLRVVLVLGRGRLLFEDARKFGRLYLVPDADLVLESLGPEPLGANFTEKALAACLSGRRRAVKSLLLDQRIVAGMGNVYADEALHAASIAPGRQACTLSATESAALWAAIRSELERGIGNRGTTLTDYRDPEGRPGRHREQLRVYGRAGQHCVRCGTRIERLRIGGRSSYHCPRCQR
jgi:formamidopyrimidine-DNA glycosylase